MICNINGIKYTFLKNFQDNDKLRHSLDILAQNTFNNLSFEEWYKQGFWKEKCSPYTLFDEEKAVANIFVNKFDVIINNVRKHYLQLGTIMTDKEYRNNGLARFLMEKILAEWKDKCDLIYLFANDSVVNFYPKFGFIKEYEYQYSMPILSKNGDLRKLDISKDVDKNLLLEKCKYLNPFSATPMIDSYVFVMFHCLVFMKNHTYYSKNFDAVIIAEQVGTTLFCYDVFCDTGKSLADILSIVADSQTSNAVLGFTPIDYKQYIVTLSKEIDTTLFVLDNKENIFKNNRLMFPMLCRT